MLTDVLFVLLLILFNGALAMSEIAIVSSRRPRLAGMAEGGSRGAALALVLGSEPTRFLSTVQVGITSVGVLSGAIGEATIARHIRAALERTGALAPYADALSLAATVVGITYVSLIVGELVPKRLALIHPERIAAIIARPMQVLAAVGRPLVYVLSLSTDTVLRLLRVRRVKQPVVTMEEIRLLFEQGTEEGVFEPSEHEMVTNVLGLDERHVQSVMTPRSDVVFLDVRDPGERTREKLREDPHTVLPLCDGGLDHVLGVVRSTRVIQQLLDGGTLELPAMAEPALFVPETTSLMKLLEQFKRNRMPVALVINEFGDIEGLVSLTDVVAAIVGDLPAEPGEEPAIVRRQDGSWLFDGALDLEIVARTLGIDSLLAEGERPHYHTLGGLVMWTMGRVPRTGDTFERAAHRFEVIDMDGHRVDRVLVSRSGTAPGGHPAPGPGPDF